MARRKPLARLVITSGATIFDFCVKRHRQRENIAEYQPVNYAERKDLGRKRRSRRWNLFRFKVRVTIFKKKKKKKSETWCFGAYGM